MAHIWFNIDLCAMAGDAPLGKQYKIEA